MPSIVRGFTRMDAFVVLLVGVLQIAGTTLAAIHTQETGHRTLDLGGYLLLALGPVLLLWRNRYPATALVAVLATALTYSFLDYPRGPVFVALTVVFVHTILHGKRGIAYSVLFIGYLSFMLAVPWGTGRDTPATPILVGVAAWMLVLLIGSELIGMQRAVFSERRRRAREAELTRDADARRRASEERLEIARELHDVMAHSISLINVQAGVALELMDRQPEQARQALTAIKGASKDALLEVQSMLAALRGTQAPAEAGSRPSPPSLCALEKIVDRARLSGIKVHTRVEGDPLPLPPATDQAGARIVQEALTNVARHAGTAVAQLRICYRHEPGPGEVLIVVDNEHDGNAVSADTVTATGGRGIAGMRERAQACGGTLVAGPRPGGFRVEARLPVDQEKPVGHEKSVGHENGRKP